MIKTWKERISDELADYVERYPTNTTIAMQAEIYELRAQNAKLMDAAKLSMGALEWNMAYLPNGEPTSKARNALLALCEAGVEP